MKKKKIFSLLFQVVGLVVILGVSAILAEGMMVVLTVAAMKIITLAVWDGMTNKATSFFFFLSFFKLILYSA